MSDIEFDASAYERPLRRVVASHYVDGLPTKLTYNPIGFPVAPSKICSVVVDLPPSTNRANRVGNGRVYKSEITREWQMASGLAFRRAMNQREPTPYPVELAIDFYVRTLSSDVSNRIKALEDAANGIVWHDDKQITKLVIRKLLSHGTTTRAVVCVRVDSEAQAEVTGAIMGSAKRRERKASRLTAAVYR